MSVLHALAQVERLRREEEIRWNDTEEGVLQASLGTFSAVLYGEVKCKVRIQIILSRFHQQSGLSFCRTAFGLCYSKLFWP